MENIAPSQVGAWDNFISSPVVIGLEFLDFMILLVPPFLKIFCTISVGVGNSSSLLWKVNKAEHIGLAGLKFVIHNF